MHFGPNPIGDAATLLQQDLLLRIENPDLVVLSGDAVSGSPHQDFEWIWRTLTEPMRKRNIPWAYVNGNHDVEGKLNGSEIVRVDQKYGGLTQHGPTGIVGASNYVLPIHSGGSQVANVFMFDSMRRGCHGEHGYGCVGMSTVEWYRTTSKTIRERNGRIIPAVSFLHIPFQEFMDVWNQNECFGRKDEPVCCSYRNTALFTAMLEQKDILGVFAGHDHKNDYHGFYDNIMLAYGRKTGFGGYSPLPSMMRGARVIELTASPFSIKTWIRQEDGTIGELSSHKPDPSNVQVVCKG